jgi:hypothetical protein
VIRRQQKSNARFNRSLIAVVRNYKLGQITVILIVPYGILIVIMAVFCITRKKFLDRVLPLDDLAALAEMLRQWSLIVAGDQEPSNLVYGEARIYAFPRPDREAMRLSLSARLPEAVFPECGPDELHVTGPPTSTNETPDLSVWREVLCDPQLVDVCIFLRLRIAEPPNLRVNRGVGRSNGTTTLALCGAASNGTTSNSTPASGGLLLKGVWPVWRREGLPPFIRVTAWPREKLFLETFDSYLADCAQQPADLAAARAFARYGRAKHTLFRPRSTDALLPPLGRFLFEGSQHSPASFARRVGIALVSGLALTVGAIASRGLPEVAFVARWGAICFFAIAAWIVILKLLIIGFHYLTMRRYLKRHYATPLECQETDLSHETWPTLLKFDKELERLGARRVCDLSFESPPAFWLGRRVYVIGDASVDLMLHNGATNSLAFPAVPLLTVSTRFSDGCAHHTTTIPVYRKWSSTIRTGRCLLNGEGIDEMLTSHRHDVDTLKRDGAVPIPPEITAADVIKQICRAHEESREMWRKAPYSLADAVRQAFEICCKEFRSR